MAEVQHGSISCRSYDVIDRMKRYSRLPYFIAVLCWYGIVDLPAFAHVLPANIHDRRRRFWTSSDT